MTTRSSLHGGQGFALAAVAILTGACAVHSYDSPHAARYASEAEDVAADADPSGITVVSFNIQRSERVEEAIAQLRSDPALRDADILLLQEMDAAGASDVARALRMHHVYYPSYVDQGRQSGAAVLSRFPILEDRAIVLPAPNPFDGRRRRAVRAIVDAPGGPLLVHSVHLIPPYMSIRGRRAQARRVLEDALSFDLPAIIGGDFNTLEPESVRRIVQDYRIFGFHWVSREIDVTADYWFGSLRLDHIFARGLSLVASGAPRTDASDHRPVWVKLRRARPRTAF